MLKKVIRYLVVLAVAALYVAYAGASYAQTVSRTTTVSFDAPTTNTDGTTITGAVTYNLYNGPSAGPFTKLASGLSPVTCPAGVTPPPGGVCLAPQAFSAASPCFALTASAVGESESNPSNTSCVKIPGSPGGFTVTVIVTVS